MGFRVLFVLLVLGGSLPTQAHQLKSDGDVGALLHIEPGDQPQAGVPQQVWFNLVKRGGTKITPGQCNCTLTLNQGPQRLSQTALSLVNKRPTARVTFPKQGRYTLVLTGTAKTAALPFQPFILRWNVQVSR
ncbi:hypothetical protein [Candidatus Cyanaurora vandensis]|uniref:hypothetical protein n=1 Tax=Candidatus Cyanaurora vandensis TaxID=2714958 RepID=UPI00257C8C73|nr:hypothetical protein [Candidatus Cyanaurora vandensis]